MNQAANKINAIEQLICEKASEKAKAKVKEIEGNMVNDFGKALLLLNRAALTIIQSNKPMEIGVPVINAAIDLFDAGVYERTFLAYIDRFRYQKELLNEIKVFIDKYKDLGFYRDS
ncbi:MAG: hypothetical protein ABFD08_08000 [Syntrophomonas sp.]